MQMYTALHIVIWKVAAVEEHRVGYLYQPRFEHVDLLHPGKSGRYRAITGHHHRPSRSLDFIRTVHA